VAASLVNNALAPTRPSGAPLRCHPVSEEGLGAQVQESLSGGSSSRSGDVSIGLLP
jgi:hypothetical protein